MPSFLAVSPIVLPSTEIAATTARWPGASVSKRAPDLALARSLFRLGRRRVERFVEHDLQAAADLPERIDQLEPRDGVKPRLDRQIAPPGVAFQVDGKKRFLHDVLWIDAALSGAAPCKAANERGRAAKKLRIGPFVTLESGFQQPRKLGFLLAAHQRTLLLRCVRRLRYVRPVAAGISPTPGKMSITKR